MLANEILLGTREEGSFDEMAIFSRRRRGGRSTVFRGGEISRYAHAGSFNGVCYENFAAAASGNEEGRFRKSDESAKSPGEIT